MFRKNALFIITSLLIVTAVFCLSNYVSVCSAAVLDRDTESVMLRFSNLTKYKGVKAEDTLADMVAEQLINSGAIRLKEMKSLTPKEEQVLYEKHGLEIRNAGESIKSGDFSILFDGPGFNDKYAAFIGTAETGQIIQTDILPKIGRENNVKYLIHGSVIKLGNDRASDGVILPGTGEINTNKVKVYVECALRVIEAETGRVIWCEKAAGIESDSELSSNIAKFGKAKGTSQSYYKATETVVQQLLVKFQSSNGL